ncbi:MAG TPA: hypothetical protein VFE65_20140 [Pseudonocardia sp.]|nr:hypothetical protein [Pseudonocardia sp.]
MATKQESREKTAMEVLTDPKFLISNGVNLNKNAMRAKSTLDGAAQRHGIRSENALLKARLGEMDALKAEQAGDPAEAATLRAQSDQALDRALKEEGLAAHYQGKVQQLTDLTKPHPPGTPVLDRLGRPLGNVPPVVQKALGTSVFDHMNRPAVPGQSAVKNALPFLRESTFGGDNAMELARRGLTKLGGVATVAFAARDVYKDVQAGDSVPRALVKTGSGVAVGAVVGGLAQAGVAAMAVPGAGWAVGAGLLAGAGASYLWTKYDMGTKVADGASAAGKVIGEGVKNGAAAIGDRAAAVGRGVSDGVAAARRALGFG